MKKLSSFVTILAALSLNIAPVQAGNKQLEVNLKSNSNLEQNQIEKISNSSSYRYCFRFAGGGVMCLLSHEVE